MTAARTTDVTLSAPTTGAMAGIVLFGDRRAPKTNTIDFGGGAQIDINGAALLLVLLQDGRCAGCVGESVHAGS